MNEIKVWDPLVRVFHWLLVACFFTAYFTEGEWQTVHVWAGYIIFSLLLIRLVWGFVGPRYARFSDFVHAPATVFKYLGQVLARRAPRHLGHNPAGGAMIVALLLCLLATTVSGAMLYGADAWLGPLAPLMQNVSDETIDLLKEVHEFFANFTLFLVAMHVLGVIWESVLHRENLVRAMLHGRKRAEVTEQA